MPDPKLRELNTRILELMRDNDVCGLVILESPGHADVGINLQSSWTCVRQELDSEGKMLRIVCNSTLYPDQSVKEKKLSNTIGCLLSLLTVMGNVSEKINGLCREVCKKVDVSHFDHEEQEPET